MDFRDLGNLNTWNVMNVAYNSTNTVDIVG